MNCFEARKDFRAFWRKALSADRSQELLSHLKLCAPCDQAFRLFALTAPVLHSEADTVEAMSKNNAAIPDTRTAGIEAVDARARRPATWPALCAGISIIVAAGFAAYLAAAAPNQSLSDALTSSQSQPATEIFGGREMPVAFDNLAG